jgi:glutamate N-acetyltransferase/amino-acid N-acetyltransferase
MYEILIEGNVCSPQGFQANGVRSGIKESGKPDLAMLFSEKPARCFGVFTQNNVQAAPVILDREILEQNTKIHGVIVNSGNANACTGAQGMQNAQEMVKLAEKETKSDAGSFLVCSTGIIGHQLPMEKIRQHTPELVPSLSERGGHHFAEAIMTTDTRSKHIGAAVATAHGVVKIGGASKGSGMIHPNMATMLAFVSTDIALPDDFQEIYQELIEASFNSITVDGDQSTNDTSLLFANGASGIAYADLNEQEKQQFVQALGEVLQILARKIIEDGEGATKLVTFQVEQARTREEARSVARFVANSKLVKTAVFGEDPNWGRLLSAAGSSGVKVKADAIDIYIGEHQVVLGGCGTGIDEDVLRKIVCLPEYTIRIVLGLGKEEARVWASDLSYEYVRINAEYTT